MPTYAYSDAGLALTKSFEGLRQTAYQDSGGVWTVGYGHTGPSILAGLTITRVDAEALLRADLAEAVTCVNRTLRVPVLQHQFDALVDFTFNAGRGNLLQSTLLRKVNLGDFAGAAAQFALWVHAGGEIVAGLVRRRAAEAAMFRGETESFAQAA
jgi:lysozyme